MDSNSLIQMSSSWLLSLGCAAAGLFFLLINVVILFTHAGKSGEGPSVPAARKRRFYILAFITVVSAYCILNALLLATRSLQGPGSIPAVNILSSLPLLAVLFFYKTVDSFVNERFFTVFTILQLAVIVLAPFINILPDETVFFTNLFLFLWYLSVLGFGFYHFSRHISRAASGNILLLVIMVSLVFFILSLVNDLSLSAFDFTMVPDHIQIAGLTILCLFLTALHLWETPRVLKGAEDKTDPRMAELRAFIASLRALYAFSVEISGNAENSAERLLSLIRNTIKRTSESIERIHSVDSQIKVNISDLKNCLNGFIADISPVLEDRLKTEKSAKSVEDISNILEEIENKGKIVSSGVVNLTSIIDNAKKNTDKSHRIILDIRTDLDNIDSFSQTIEKVSEEANTLAMNAAIESAGNLDAGGTGFKVVSNDLRELSSKIKGQTEEIKTVLATLKKDLDAGITSTEKVRSFFIEIEMITENIFRLILDIVSHSNGIAGTITESRANIDSLHQLSEHMEKLFHDNRSLTDDLSKEIEITRNNFYQIAMLIGKGKDIFDTLQERSASLKGKTDELCSYRESSDKFMKGLTDTNEPA